MNGRLNPYSTPETLTLAPDDEPALRFDGVITEDNYVQLMMPVVEWMLIRVLLGLLVPCCLVVLGVTAFATFIKDDKEIAIPGVAGTAILASGIGVCLYLGNSRMRARYFLKRYPDSLGSVRGRFDAHGLTVSHGSCTRWFSWPGLSQMTVSRNGLRVPFADHPYHVLALTTELFEFYSAERAREIVDRYSRPEIDTDQLLDDASHVFKPVPSDRDHFSGWTESTTGKWSRARFAQSLLEIGFGVSIFAISDFSSRFVGDIDWGLRLAAGMALLFGVIHGWQCFFGRTTTQHFQWGWLDSDSLIIGIDYVSSRISVKDVRCIAAEEKWVLLQDAYGTSLVLFAEHFKQQPGWIRAREAFGVRANGDGQREVERQPSSDRTAGRG